MIFVPEAAVAGFLADGDDLWLLDQTDGWGKLALWRQNRVGGEGSDQGLLGAL